MDLVLVSFVAGLTFGGWRTGFVHRVVGLAFIAIAFVLGAYLRGPFGTLVNGFFPDMPADYAELLGYTFAFPIILGVLHIVAYPFLKDRHIGGMTRELNNNASYTVHLVRETTVSVALTVLGPLLPKDISSIVPGGLPGMPGIPGLPRIPGLPVVPGLPTPIHATPRP